jgi:pimeloyl-ACP methyl ester carboxylesterase
MRYLKRVMALMAPTFALLTGCADSNPLPQTLTLVECRIPKLPTAAQCGTIDVPENRDNPESRKITIAFAVLRASTLKPLPDPLFILAGGPGQAASYLGPFAAKLTDLRKSRDIVLVDQRGTGRSSPLTCAAFAFGSAAINKLDGDQSHQAADCVKELSAQGVDAAQYTTSEWVKDLNEVRLGLGYKKINLWGGSYGTRVAIEYARQYSDHVRSAILDGVVPPSMQIGFDVWQTRDIALSNIIDKCKTTRACQARHPDLGAALNTIKANLGVNGKEVVLNDPRTGQSQKHHLNFDHLVSALQQLTYSPELSALIPEIIIRAADGDYGPLYASANQVTADLAKQMNIALYYAVTCSDDVLRMAPSNTTDPTTRIGSKALAQRTREICEAWPKGKIQNNAAQPLSSRLPTLILSGGLDPATPPSNGTEVARSLPSSRHIVARGYGHIVSAHACGPRLIAAFVDQPDFSTLPSACVDHFEKSIEPALWADNLGRQ